MVFTQPKHVPPAVDQQAFNCPHCAAFAQQSWFNILAEPTLLSFPPVKQNTEQGQTPFWPPLERTGEQEKVKKGGEPRDPGWPSLSLTDKSKYARYDVNNLFVAQCFSCKDVSIWVHDRLVWPQRGAAPLPNPDLPDDIRLDYEEASAILDRSPRGAAALLRLAIQKLCRHLGEKGENLNEDIGSLVKKGLTPLEQQALDVVRVIGNNAVHPGQIDLRDDRPTAESLFGLVNLISEVMISRPKHVGEMYAGLPERARKVIETRDGCGG